MRTDPSLTAALLLAAALALGCGSAPAENPAVNTAASCGNGVSETGEVCDDGNIIDGDGCSSTCRSNETCGNGVRDPDELCDWALDPAPCSSACVPILFPFPVNPAAGLAPAPR